MSGSKPFPVSRETLRDIVNSLQQGRSQARSLETITDSLEVLCDDDRIRGELAAMSKQAAEIATSLNAIYKMIAREAMA